MGLDGGQIEQNQGPPIDAMEWSGASLPFLWLGRRSRSSSSPRTRTSCSNKSKVWGRKMMVGASITIQEDGSLVALGATVLTEVRGNVLVRLAAGGGMLNSAFLGVRSAPAGSRNVFPVRSSGDHWCCCCRCAGWRCCCCIWWSCRCRPKGQLRQTTP